jgi:hypothetical protein
MSASGSVDSDPNPVQRRHHDDGRPCPCSAAATRNFATDSQHQHNRNGSGITRHTPRTRLQFFRVGLFDCKSVEIWLAKQALGAAFVGFSLRRPQSLESCGRGTAELDS